MTAAALAQCTPPLLGIAVGITAVILLTSIGGHSPFCAGRIRSLAPTSSISPGKVKTSGPRAHGYSQFSAPDHLEDTTHCTAGPNRRRFAHGLGQFRSGRQRSVASGERQWRGADMLRVYRMGLRTGQFLPADLENARAFVVLGATLRTNCLARTTPGPACAHRGGAVPGIGVLESKGQFLGVDLDDAAYVPVARAMELFNREGMMKVDVSYREGTPAASVVDAIKRLLVARHGREDFTIVTQEDMLRTLSNILDILTMAVGALGSISLLVGGVGIVTIMTIAVRERTGEIGLMVALGAPRRTILALFLGEAVALSALGGIMGLVLGIDWLTIHLAVPALPVHAVEFRAAGRAGGHRHRPGRCTTRPQRRTAGPGRGTARG